MINNLLNQELISTTTLQKNLFQYFRGLQKEDKNKLIGVLSNNKIVGFLANKTMIDDYFALQKKQLAMEELIEDLEDTLALKESMKNFNKNELVLADDLYKELGL